MKNHFSFRVSIETNEKTGQVLAAYFRVRRGKADRVMEFCNGNLFANYNKKGELLGVEMLGPCQADVVDKIERNTPVRRFIKRNIPRRGAWARA